MGYGASVKIDTEVLRADAGWYVEVLLRGEGRGER